MQERFLQLILDRSTDHRRAILAPRNQWSALSASIVPPTQTDWVHLLVGCEPVTGPQANLVATWARCGNGRNRFTMQSGAVPNVIGLQWEAGRQGVADAEDRIDRPF